MSHIFISYSKKNKDYTDKLVDFLEKAGFNVWYDGRIDYGTSWEKEIEKAIENCAAFIVVMTPESYASEWVTNECQYASELNKPQFPLLLDGKAFLRYKSKQFVNVQGGKLPPNDFVTHLSQVIKPQGQSGKNITPPEMIASQFPIESSSIAILPPPFEWIEIPAGKVIIADNRGEFDVPKFSIAKYPTTIAQYQVFMNEKGYETEKYWTAPGWAWKQSENITQPRYWGEKGYEHFFKSNHPIIGVSWYEAIAFCQWLNEKTGENISLPTEQQWQRAAQGNTNWLYPWGNQFDEKRCNNSVQSESSGTTSVAQYPNGASPYGVMDMSGNVWEWVLTKYDDVYIINNIPRRVMRGGSWYHDHAINFHVDLRGRNSPNERYYNIGMRVARSK